MATDIIHHGIVSSSSTPQVARTITRGFESSDEHGFRLEERHVHYVLATEGLFPTRRKAIAAARKRQIRYYAVVQHRSGSSIRGYALYKPGDPTEVRKIIAGLTRKYGGRFWMYANHAEEYW